MIPAHVLVRVSHGGKSLILTKPKDLNAQTMWNNERWIKSSSTLETKRSLRSDYERNESVDRIVVHARHNQTRRCIVEVVVINIDLIIWRQEQKRLVDNRKTTKSIFLTKYHSSLSKNPNDENAKRWSFFCGRKCCFFSGRFWPQSSWRLVGASRNVIELGLHETIWFWPFHDYGMAHYHWKCNACFSGKKEVPQEGDFFSSS